MSTTNISAYLLSTFRRQIIPSFSFCCYTIIIITAERTLHWWLNSFKIYCKSWLIVESGILDSEGETSVSKHDELPTQDVKETNSNEGIYEVIVTYKGLKMQYFSKCVLCKKLSWYEIMWHVFFFHTYSYLLVHLIIFLHCLFPHSIPIIFSFSCIFHLPPLLNLVLLFVIIPKILLCLLLLIPCIIISYFYS